MSAREAMEALLREIAPTASTETSKNLLIASCAEGGVRINPDLTFMQAVTQDQILAVVDNLGRTKAVWKIVAKRALRPYGIVV